MHAINQCSQDESMVLPREGSRKGGKESRRYQGREEVEKRERGMEIKRSGHTGTRTHPHDLFHRSNSSTKRAK